MKYILTGATGHLGNNLVKMLSKDKDAEIKLLLLPGENTSIFKYHRLETAFGDILDRDFLKREIEADSIVIHMAGIVDITSDKKDYLYKVNVEGTRNMAEVSFKKHAARFVYVSSVHTIEPIPKAVLSEPLIFDTDRIVGDYAKSKTMATKIVFDMIKKGLPGVVVYPSGIIGPGDIRISNMGELFIDIINHTLNVSVTGGYNFVDVRDVCEGTLAAAKFGRIGEGYILSGHGITISDIYSVCRSVTGEKRKPPVIASWFAKVFAPLAERRAARKKRKPLFTKYSIYTVRSNHNFSYRKAEDELGYCPRPAAVSITETIKWMYFNRPELFNKKAFLRLSKKFDKVTVPAKEEKQKGHDGKAKKQKRYSR